MCVCDDRFVYIIIIIDILICSSGRERDTFVAYYISLDTYMVTID